MVIGRVFIENMTKKNIPNEFGAKEVSLYQWVHKITHRKNRNWVKNFTL
jgi:hypothetical protein